MARKTKRNLLTSPEKLEQINAENKRLVRDFLEYLRSVGRSASTIAVYENDLDIAMVWALEHIDNKPFVKWSKRDIVAFQGWLVNENGNSPARVRRLKATLSSLSNYISNICDDEYPDFRNIIHKIESPVSQAVREKTVLTDAQLEGALSNLTESGQFEKACMLALAAYSGRRKSELVRFKVSYFEKENIIFGSLYKTPELVRTKGRGEGKFIYLYTLAQPFQPYFDRWMEQRAELGVESEWLFPAPGDPMQHRRAESLNSWADTLSRMMGVDFYWHSLRHNFTTRLVRMGLPDSVIQDIIGWTSADMLRVYTDIPVDEQLGKYFGISGDGSPKIQAALGGTKLKETIKHDVAETGAGRETGQEGIYEERFQDHP